MIRLFFQDLAIYTNENLPKRIQIVPKWFHNFTKYQTNLYNFAEEFLIFAQVAKFRQIWSHWPQIKEKLKFYRSLGRRNRKVRI